MGFCKMLPSPHSVTQGTSCYCRVCRFIWLRPSVSGARLLGSSQRRLVVYRPGVPAVNQYSAGRAGGAGGRRGRYHAHVRAALVVCCTRLSLQAQLHFSTNAFVSMA